MSAKAPTPKLRYKDLHKDFTAAVSQFYTLLDRTGYRHVSRSCCNDDFVPLDISEITKATVTKKHVDKRSLSFHTNLDACHNQAVNSFLYRLDRYGQDYAENWKKGHTHIATVPLTRNDGYMDALTSNFHFNFAPYETFVAQATNLEPIDFTMEEIYYLQVQDETLIAALWIERDGQCILRIISENRAHIPYSLRIEAREVVRYMRRQVTIRELCQRRGLQIKSPLKMYEYCNTELICNAEDITTRLYDIIKSSPKWRDQLFHIWEFRTPVL